MPMKNPPHPGRSIKDACLDGLNLSVIDGAKILGVAHHTLSRVINGQAGTSPEMAIRLEKAGWSNADQWLRLQVAHDLAQARLHEDEIKVSLISRVAQRDKNEMAAGCVIGPGSSARP